MRNIRKIFNPDWFQGKMNRKNYFEGWYYKIVSADREQTWAFIPGISLSPGYKHSFIQVINGMNGETFYIPYKTDEFKPSTKSFKISLADSEFTDESMMLGIRNDDINLNGQVHFINIIRFPVSPLIPGIMGWYRYVPFMECYHGVVSLDHNIEGALNINGSQIDFNGGKGYIEKDWGTSMPQAWVWMQSNHFGQMRTSFMLSIARIPWFGSSFTGFLGFILLEGKLFPFATYTGAQVIHLDKRDEKVEVVIKSKLFTVKVQGWHKMSGALKAPIEGSMQRIIHESVSTEIQIVMSDVSGKVIFEGTGTNAGLEIVGDLKLLKYQ